MTIQNSLKCLMGPSIAILYVTVLQLSTAEAQDTTLTVNTQCSRCLNIRDQNLTVTGRTIEQGTTVVVAGEENNGFIPVHLEGQSDQVFYLSSRYLSPSTDAATEATSPTATADTTVAASTTGAIPQTFPQQASEALRRLWVFARLRHWIIQRGQDLLNTLPRDIAQYCPNYSQLTASQKINFWATLMTEVVKPESNYNTNATYTESFSNSSGQRVVSTGLFQLSLESSRGYGCPMNSQADLMDPDKNIMCAVTIMNRWVPRDNAIAQGGRNNPGGARYWSVFRRASTRNTFQQATQAYCQSPQSTDAAAAEASAETFIGM